MLSGGGARLAGGSGGRGQQGRRPGAVGRSLSCTNVETTHHLISSGREGPFRRAQRGESDGRRRGRRGHRAVAADPTAAQSQPTASEDRTRARRRGAAVRSSAPERADGPRTRAGSAWVCDLRQIVPRNGLGRRKSSPLCDGRRAAANQALEHFLSMKIYDVTFSGRSRLAGRYAESWMLRGGGTRLAGGSGGRGNSGAVRRSGAKSALHQCGNYANHLTSSCPAGAPFAERSEARSTSG